MPTPATNFSSLSVSPQGVSIARLHFLYTIDRSTFLTMGSNLIAPLPRIALFDTNIQYKWSDGTLFNGFMLVEMLLPSDGVTPWAEVDYGNLYPSIKLPLFQRIPIVDGALNDSCGLFYNSDVTPPGSQYLAWYYDASGRQIAGPTANFTVTSANSTGFTPPLLTLPLPSGLGPAPVPD